ncbi:16S rRNA (cytosine(1402)-N(4))-methyltransferase [Candidatus Roizmanbacteria bacterium RIFCSPHIGHO2_02_FULL_37_13b]|uniref:16S rRNA (Cytosine(1402)-N(4))-methyltransferase n=1 Tax=Candidatus Roizmanbacteria bacterium RIFCSPLOWO2_02_FULL_36_11 TaxID=1802071 RepID=A0A1F7JIL5_9BACT|nr:MAG: 16S rRNA (cytosine(1402)-N(4))-methyltransferase [Candidatus Roizmanbacteria bacterium RIFCSPHIGHO2_02_FULL_37_13b]OGK55453.1 MAG: 16S rRNA (cytosine(1402)-N(4))-methyltransferase [Candidatus Roizmanbacteria bacterium RIFCSPLOWO2_02_FULL_36_11]
MDKTVQYHFDKTVDDYDIFADDVVMKNNDLHQTITLAMAIPNDRITNILDLGCGTGYGSGMILRTYPQAKVTGVDFSQRMMTKAKINLNHFGDRIILLEEDFTTIKLENNKYNAVVSAIAIHNVTHSQKGKLFQSIYSWLKKGGCFINGDFIQGETALLDKEYRQIYSEYMLKRLRGKDLLIWLNHAFNQDTAMKLSEQFQLLAKVGFSKIELLWQFNNEAVYKAVK